MSARELPGTLSPYFLPTGAGLKRLMAGQLVTILARPEDTAGAFEAAVVSGGRGARVPPHRHDRGHEALLVTDGVLDLTLAGSTYQLTRGDYASIPAGAVHGYQMRGHHTELLTWTVHGAATAATIALSDAWAGASFPPGEAAALDTSRLTPDADWTLASDPPAVTPGTALAAPPTTATPYVLAAGAGERLIAGDQLFAFLSHGGNTDGAFITLSTIGPAGERIPNHFHEKHTETFFCFDGRMTMWANGEEIALASGDFLHVPAGTVHSYRLDAPYTRFFGLLSPGIFEPFFRTFCDPYDAHIFPVVPGPARFDRVIAKLGELDLKLVDPPRRPPGV